MPTTAHHENAGVSKAVVETAIELLEDAEEPLYVVRPAEWTVRALIGAAATVGESAPEIRVVGEGELLRRIRRDFLTASEAASLADRGVLELRDEVPDGANQLIVSEGTVYSLVAAGGQGALLRDTEASFAETALSAAGEAFEAGEAFPLRTPGTETIDTAMTEAFGDTFSQQFREGLDVARGMRDRTEFDPVAASLLVAAHNEELHYDVSRVGEEIGLGSRATYSRIKNQLEDDGIVTTDKEKMDLGRPRQRLRLGEQYREIAEDRGVTELIGHILN